MACMDIAANLRFVGTIFFFLTFVGNCYFYMLLHRKKMSGSVSSIAYKYYIMVISSYLSELQTTLVFNLG